MAYLRELMIRPLKSRHILTINVNKCRLPTVEKINSGFREAIDSCTIAAKEQELCDRSIMMFNRSESKAGNKK